MPRIVKNPHDLIIGFSNEMWEKRDFNRIQAAEIIYLRSVKDAVNLTKLKKYYYNSAKIN